MSSDFVLGVEGSGLRSHQVSPIQAAVETEAKHPDAPQLSVIIAVTDRYDDVESTYWSYKKALEATNLSFDISYVLDGKRPKILVVLEKLQAQGEPIKVVSLLKWFGEATALVVGSSRSSGKLILTLPPYLQIDPMEIPRFVAACGDLDMLVGARDRVTDSLLNRLQWKAFHWMLKVMLQSGFTDLGCAVRLFRREVIEEVRIYADQHRFLPLLAERHGFTVGETVLKQASADMKQRIYRPGVYVRRVLDALAIYFLLKFTRKPFRFFGLIGLSIGALGALIGIWIVIERFVYDVAMADRPLMVLAVLFGVLGVQTIAMGLIGEIIIFTRSAGTAEYWVEKTIDGDEQKGAG